MTTYSGRVLWDDLGTRWPLAPLKAVARIGTGHTPSRSHPKYWQDCTIPWVTTEDLTARTDGGLRPLLDTKQKISELGMANSAAVLHPADTVMLSRTASVGHVVRIGRPMATTQAFVTWTCGPKLDPRYLTLVLNAMKPEFMRIAYGSTHLTIYMPDLEQLRVPVPPLPVQRAIADYLDAVTAHIDTLAMRKRELRHALWDHWVQEVVEATTPDLPDSERPALRRVLASFIGGSWGVDAGEADVDALCVRGTDFDMTTLRAKDTCPRRGFGTIEFRSRRLRPGDLVIEKSGGGENQPVGRVIEWTDDLAAVPTNFAARLRPVSGIESRFLTYVFRAAYEVGLTRSWINQTTGIQNLDLGGLLSERWPIPSREHQRSVIARLDQATDYRLRGESVLESQIGLLTEHRQALITAAVTGHLEVPGVAA